VWVISKRDELKSSLVNVLSVKVKSLGVLRQVATAIFLYLVLIGGALACDRVLHQLGWQCVGKWAGPVGVGIILLGFAHSARRRTLIQRPSVRLLLSLHELFGWVGALLILVHAGVHFGALIPWLAVAMMLLVVASGFVGRTLLVRTRRTLLELERKGSETELLASLMVEAMKRWRSVHWPLTAVLAALVIVHVVAELLLWP
jgi:hypothetical protein